MPADIKRNVPTHIPPPTPITSKSESTRGIPLPVTIILMVLAALVSGGSVYFGQLATSDSEVGDLKKEITSLQQELAKSQSSTQTTQPAPSAPTATPLSSPTPTAPVAYSNTKYNFTLTIPKSWQVLDESRKSIEDDPTGIKLASQLNFMPSNSETTVHSLQTSDKVLQTIIDEQTNEVKTKLNYKKISTTFAGRAATQLSWTETQGSTNIADKKVIIFPKDKTTFIFTGITKDYQKAGGIDLGNFDTITSSFKFTK